MYIFRARHKDTTNIKFIQLRYYSSKQKFRSDVLSTYSLSVNILVTFVEIR